MQGRGFYKPGFEQPSKAGFNRMLWHTILVAIVFSF